MAQCNAVRLKGLNQDCNRIAVKSTNESSWQLPYKTHWFSRPAESEKAILQNELVVISFQDGSGAAELEITPMGDQVGTLLMQSSRNEHKVLRVGAKYRFKMRPGESITLRNHTMIHPTGDKLGGPI